jgi:hypothetical protein
VTPTHLCLTLAVAGILLVVALLLVFVVTVACERAGE